MASSDVTVTNTDDDTVGVTVIPALGLVTTEAGGTAKFTMTLTSQPTTNVVITVSSNDITEGTVSPTALTFTTANWNTGQDVTVTGVDDLVTDGNIAYSIVTTLVSADTLYAAINPTDVAVTNTDNDASGITVTATTLANSETGTKATYTLVLTSQPTADVVIPTTSSDTSEASVGASVTFTAANWNTAQTVTVTGVDDFVADGTVTYYITNGPATSTDTTYTGLTGTTVNGANSDNDAAGINVSPTTGTTTEAGGTATFNMVLTSQPTADVVVAVSSSDTTECTVSPTLLTFTAATWNTLHAITVTGVDDKLDDGDMACKVVTAPAVSTDAGYNSVDASDITVTNIDDDTAGITVTTTSTVTSEAGTAITFKVVLQAQPSANVIVPVASSDTTEGTVAPASLTFTNANWNTAQTVTVTGVDDALVDGTIAYTVALGPSTSTDTAFNSLSPAPTALTNTDNDVAGFTVTPTEGLTTTESGGTASFTIVMTSQPTAAVTVPLVTTDATEGTVAPASVTFSTTDWNIPKVVTITGVDDAVDDGDVAFAIVTQLPTTTDTSYASVNAADVAVTNLDDDTFGVTVSTVTGTPTEAGGTAKFSVQLASQPTSTVTIPVSSSDLTEGTVSPASLTFTAATWSTAQDVTITGVDDTIDDGNVAYKIVLGAIISSDVKYNAVDPPDVSVTTIDDDTAGITVTPTSGLSTTEAGGTATFTVVLLTQPTADVTIPVVSADTTEGIAAPGSLTFTTADWNAARTVTVTGQDDAVADGNVVYTVNVNPATSSDANYNGIKGSDVSMTNTDNDTPGITVTPLAGVTTEAGGTTTFQVALNTQPTASVTIALTSSDITEGVVTPASITFTTTNWNTAQVVTVTGQDDAVDDGDVTYTIATGAAISSDAGYNTMNAADVTVTNTDNDLRGVTVTPTSGLTTTEAGGTATFSVALNTEPTAAVTIALSTSDATEGSVLPTSLTFTAATWNTAQVVTVTGVDDTIDDDNVLYTVVTGTVVSTDTVYSGLVVPDVSVTNTDDDTAGIVTSKTAISTSEAGAADTFTVVLATEPTSTVTIPLASSYTSEATISPATLTFTTTNWGTPQVVTVTGVDDTVADGNQAYQVLLGATVSTDPKYSGKMPSPIAGSNTDNDAAGIVITQTPPMTTTEAGGTTTFKVKLGSQPVSNVVVPIDTAALDTTEGTVSPTSLTFTSANWNTDQTVTVTGVDDSTDDGDVSYVVAFSAASSADPLYNSMVAKGVTVVNTDDDTAGITVSPTGGLTTTEAGGTAIITTALATAPVADVTLSFTTSDASEGTVSPPSVTFNAANWNKAQHIVITGVQDAIDDGDVVYTIFTNTASTDAKYAAINPPDVTVTNMDDDTAGISVSPTSGLATTEGGGSATFTVSLQTEPISDVTIPVAVSDATEASVSPASVVFTTTNWNMPQTVTVTGVDDKVADGDVAFTVNFGTISGSDAVYTALKPTAVGCTNQDDDTAGIIVTPSATPLKTIESGTTATFTVMLASEPTADVTIPLVSSDTTEGLAAPSSLVFTAANWNKPQVVTVTGQNDDISDGGIAYQIQINAATSTDTKYNAMNAPDVFALNEDDDVAGISVSPTTGLSTTEKGGQVMFEMKIASEPMADITVTLTSNDTTEGTVSPASVVFKASNWKIPQIVTVTGVDDLIDDGNVVYTIVTGIATGGDTAYAGTNPDDVIITNADDETAGITVTPRTGLVTTEAGGTVTFSVMLNTQPTADVTVPVNHCASGDLTEVTASPCSLTFTTTTWNTPQVVTLTGVDDFIDDGDQTVTVALGAVASADMTYNNMLAPNVIVTNKDDDAKGITVTPTSGLTTTEAGGQVSFTVRLTSQPVASVSIPIQSSDVSEGTVSTPNLVFDGNNWNVPQTVTVTGVDEFIDDGDQGYLARLAPAVSADPVYNGYDPADVSITNTDDDTAGVTVSKTSIITWENGTPQTFTVMLLSQPVADVSVTLRSGDLSEGTVSPASLVFTNTSWNSPQQVTVTPVNDNVADGNITYVVETGLATSADPKYNFMNPSDVSVTNVDDEVPGYVVTPTTGLVTSEAGGTATFSVVLRSEPVGDVTVSISSNDTTEGVPSPSAVTFGSSNWNVSQVITVKGVDDNIDDGNVAYIIGLLPVASGDPQYAGVDMMKVAVINVDDDTATIVVASAAPLVTTETGVKATFTVALGTQPQASVTVPIASSDTTEGTPNVASLVFNPVNWNTPQTVTVAGVDDAVADGDIPYVVSVGPASSTDTPFNGLMGTPVNATNKDDDTASVTVQPKTGLAVKEQGATSATFFVSLTSEPTSNVNIPLSTVSVDQISVGPPVLTFTVANWATPQQVTVTAVDDSVADGDKTVTVVVGQATSSDSKYTGMDPDDVVISVVDNDAAGLRVSPLSGLITTEAGGTAQFKVSLTSEPLATVTVNIQSNNVAEGTVSASSLTFTPATWTNEQSVTVAGVQDLLQDGNIAYQVLVGPASSTDSTYNAMGVVTVSVTNIDDDTAGITVSPTVGLTTTEDGATCTVTVMLNTQPTANATYSVTTSDATEGTVSPAALMFTPDNWNFRQTVTITGADDTQRDGDVTYQVTVAPSGSKDPLYNNLAPVVMQVVNKDNEIPGVTVSPLVLTVTEWGTAASFTVVLQSPPTDILNISVASTDTTEGTVSPTWLSFSAANWNVKQSVVVTGVDDTIVDGNVAFMVQLAPPTTTDTAYAAIDPSDVTVTNLDDDPSRPPLCDAYSSPNCVLRSDAATVLCPAGGCDDTTCCAMCNSFDLTQCRSGLLVDNAATTTCPLTGCDTQNCCKVIAPPPGAVTCSQYSGTCQLISDAAFVACPPAGCNDATCCTTCEVFNATNCPTKMLRPDFKTTYCGFRGCDAPTCCKPDLCYNVFCKPVSQCHEAGNCDPSSGLCTTPLRPGGSPCDDGNTATVNDACDAVGSCVGTSKCTGVVCTAKTQCHNVGTCDPATGICSEPAKTSGATCNDGLPETTNDVCLNGACAGTVTCLGGTCTPSEPQCHTSGCGVQGGTPNAPLKCVELPKADGTPCDDGNALTTNDKCVSGICVGVQLCKNVICTAASQCHGAGTCNPATGVCSTPLLQDLTPCDDKNANTRDDMCFKGQCLGQDKCLGVICRASTQCNSVGTCDPSTGLCSDPPVAVGVVCNDGDSTTTNDKCDGSGNCIGELACAPCAASEPKCHIARCGDGGSCTEISRPDGTSCNDGLATTLDDTCKAGKCVGRLLCDGVACTADQCHIPGTCDPATGRCSTPVQPDNTPCNDGKDTTKDDVCISGTCVGVPKCSGVVCPASDPCHAPGTCDPQTGLCSDPVIKDGAPCDDGNDDTTNDNCQSGVCTGTTNCGSVTCTATDPQCRRSYCTANRCAEVMKADGTPCNDNNPETQNDQCMQGSCIGKALCANVQCPVTSQCRGVTTCNVATGLCTQVGPVLPDGSPCDDGMATTVSDRCVGGTCVGVAVCERVTCVAADQCHEAGACNPVTGLCSSPPKIDGATCNDGNQQTTNDNCVAGACIGTITCAGTACVPTEPQCKRAACSGDVCTEIAKPDGTPCDDGLPETFDDKCQNGKCVGNNRCIGVVCVAASQCHDAGVCQPLTGVCSTPIKADGNACNDGLAQTVDDKCMNGVCTGVDKCAGVVCPTGVCMGTPTCNPSTGQCSSQPLADGTACDDGDGATTNDVCTQATCAGTLLCNGVMCPVSEPQCHTAACNNNTCQEVPKQEDTPCNDGNPKTVGDKCIAGVCMGVDNCANVACMRKGQCYAEGKCDPLTGKCTNPLLPDRTACDDGSDATVSDVCSSGVCKGKGRCDGIICTASDQCHDAGVCDASTGLCTDPPKSLGTPCNDNNPGTSDDNCVSGVCTGTVTCGGVLCTPKAPECNFASCNGATCSQTPMPDNTPCNDKNSATFNDICRSGVCAGTDKCAGVVCAANSTNTCFMPGTCEPSTGRCTTVMHADGSQCDDGDPKTSGDKCQSGVCVGVNKCANVVCTSSDACHTAGTCDFMTGICSDPVQPDGVACDDGNDFSINDQCQKGVCLGTTVCSAQSSACPVSDAQCNVAACDNGQCVKLAKQDGTPCNDGNAATSGDVCNAGKCMGVGKCDNVDCQADMCNEAGTCDPATGACASSPKVDGTKCDDGNPVTIGDACTGGVCLGTSRCKGVVCPGATGCRGAGTCDANTGTCVYATVSNGTPCNDGVSATVNDTCVSGICTGSVPCAGKTCTVFDPRCSVPACNANQCVELAKTEGTQCDDGNGLTFDDACRNGVCVGVTKCAAVVCKPLSNCFFAGTCEPSTGVCSTPAKPDGTACDDGNPLTLTSECVSGVCVSSDKCVKQSPCVAKSQCHDIGTCDPATGQCSNPPKPDGTPCDDRVLDTTNDQCKSGVCAGTKRCAGVLCSASDSCHLAGVCDPNTGLCSDPLKPDGSQCDDGNPLTQGDACAGGQCWGQGVCAGAPCSSTGPQCKVATCTGSQCVQVPKTDGTKCNDGDIFTSNDACLGGVCKGISLCANTVCPETQCQNTGTCDPGTGKCNYVPKQDGTQCDDGDATTFNDICTSGRCMGQQKCSGVTCTPRSACHDIGVCDMQTGLCTEPVKPTGTPCDDGQPATLNDQCAAGTCQGTLVCGNVLCANSNPQCATLSCVSNRCVETLKKDGAACDDKDTTTLDDQCIGGACAGTNPCSGVVCTVVSQCHVAGTCEPLTGKCTTPVKPNRTPCNDGQASTTDDMCMNGVCIGTDRCSGVVCGVSDQCHGTGVCDPSTGVCSDPLAPDGASCNDGNPSTIDDKCLTGVCYGSLVCASSRCHATSPCRTPVCSGVTCSEQALPDNTLCNDNDPSTMYDKCLGGECRGVNLCAGVVCYAASQCHDVGVCDITNGLCTSVPLPDGTACDDQNGQTANDHCTLGSCLGVTKCTGVSCLATDGCHETGVCDPFTGLCSQPLKPSGEACDDGDASTTNDRCINGACIGSITCGGSTCSASTACMVPTCVSSKCSEMPRPDNTACNDNNPSTFGDKCVSGACKGVNKCDGVICTAISPCHSAGVCDPSSGKCPSPIMPDTTPCNDNNVNTVGDQCIKGVCVGKDLCRGVVCTASDDCHSVGVCNPNTGLCSDPAKPGGTPCDDGNPDTSDDKCNNGACTGIVTCRGMSCTVQQPMCMMPTCSADQCIQSNKPDGTTCNDANPGTTNDVCLNGVCAGIQKCASVVCIAQDQCHSVGVCSEATGECSNPVQTDGTPCDDGSPQTVGDECILGVCIGRDKCAGVICQASDSCHDLGSCDPSTGLCTDPKKIDGSLCNDLDITTVNDKCQNGVCVGTLQCGSNQCSPSIPGCVRSSCSNGQCIEIPRPDGTTCNDGQLSTLNDKCLNGLCVGTNPCAGVVCKAMSQCHYAGDCELVTGKCTNPIKPDGTLCDDGLAATVTDVCTSGLCNGKSKCAGVICPTGPCLASAGYCDPATGLCTSVTKPDGSACDDGDPLTQEDRCMNGQCRGAVPPTCGTYTGSCTPLSNPNATKCPAWSGCTADICCKRATCNTFSVTTCQLRPDAATALCPVAGCDMATCCSTCATIVDVSQCSTREVQPTKACPAGGCTPTECCLAGTPMTIKAAVDVRGAPGNTEAAAAALANALGVPRNSLTDVKVVRGVNGTSRLTGTVTRSTNNPDGTLRNPAAVAAALMSNGTSAINSQPVSNLWNSVGVPVQLVAYPSSQQYPQTCSSSTANQVCGSDSQYGCPLKVICERGMTPCCSDPDGACDDGDDRVACVPYAACPSSGSKTRVCGAVNAYGCPVGVTCNPTQTACCSDTDGSCTDGDDDVSCVAPNSDECQSVGNTVCANALRGAQTCTDPSSAVGDWQCVCSSPKTGQAVAMEAVCAPAPSDKDIYINVSSSNETQVSNEIAAMLGVSPGNVVATRSGAGSGKMRVVLPTDAMRTNFLTAAKSCAGGTAPCTGTQVKGVDINATECAALQEPTICKDKSGCAYVSGVCMSAADSAPGAAPGGDDSGGLPLWLILLLVLAGLLCLIACCVILLRKKDPEQSAPPPNNQAYEEHQHQDLYEEPATTFAKGPPPPPASPHTLEDPLLDEPVTNPLSKTHASALKPSRQNTGPSAYQPPSSTYDPFALSPRAPWIHPQTQSSADLRRLPV
eukprot:TRINITY_DN5151_c0_g1_i9.p1 TRINITY_DN5151_c0_g1~~TRINITY_DN5151_c0_g1_i9.p1  ORF type:complete len:6713 (+),score=1239.17 TRINITY_DN5151_c0_g1_i9:1796-20140(+)